MLAADRRPPPHTPRQISLATMAAEQPLPSSLPRKEAPAEVAACLRNAEAAAEAAACLREAKENGAGLAVLTGAGMSVSSGVPVFRSADGSMSADFLAFLAAFNEERRNHGLPEADDWFSFSVADMFRAETEKSAWAYWRWRILRALVEPAEDYRLLKKVIDYFGDEKVFVRTSNCDMLHVKAGFPESRCHEIHGSLGRLQCSAHCCDELHPVDATFLKRLEAEPDWVPRCPRCKKSCLRPNVMIFSDTMLEHSCISEQAAAWDAFVAQFDVPETSPPSAAAETGPAKAELTKIRKVFDDVDRDKSGKIDKAELRAACSRLGQYLLDADADTALAAMDADGDGTVDFEEFARWWWEVGRLSPLEQLERKLQGFKDAFENMTKMAFSKLAGLPTSTLLGSQKRNLVVLEIGAGVVVPSIRAQAESLAAVGCGLVRINPSGDECTEMQTGEKLDRYCPLTTKSSHALAALVDALEL
eukprot:SAG31_NODE_1142_length_9696_cov_3.874232_9_plen_474_part_00